MSNSDGLIIQSVINSIEKADQDNVYGHIILGLDESLVKNLVDSLTTNFGKTFISVIGYSEQLNDSVAIKSSNIGFSAAHAVDVRNSSDIDGVRIVIALEEERKFGSLKQRGYQIIDEYILMLEICELGLNKAENDPERNLWEALKTAELSSYLTINRILEFYTSVIENKKSPRTELVKLNLIPDKEILSGKFKSLHSLKNRLIQNIELLDRIQRGDSEDRSKIIDTVNINKDNKRVKDLYSLYTRLSESDFSILHKVDFSDIEQLFSRKMMINISSDEDLPSDTNADDENEEEKNGNDEETDDLDGDEEFVTEDEENKRESASLNTIRCSIEEAALDLVMKGDSENQLELFKKISEIVKKDKIEKNTITLHGKNEKYEIEFNPNNLAIIWNNNFILYDEEMSPSKSLFGGEIYLDEEIDILEVQKNPKLYLEDATFYDDIFMAEFRGFTTKYKEMNAGFSGDQYLNEYLTVREKLVEHKEILATEPLSTLLLNEEIRELVDSYIKLYQKLSEQLQRNYSEIKRIGEDGAKKNYQDFLKIDTVKLYSNTDIHVVLTSLSPFVLWKNLEIAKLIHLRSDKLNVNDKSLLLKEIKYLPEPLLTYTTTFNGNYETLAFSSRLGSLPIYSKNEILNADLNQKSLGISALKISHLYPYVKENLRILLVDPLSTEEVSSTLKRLLNKYGFKKITLILVKLNTKHLIPYDAVLKELSHENKVNIEVHKFNNVTGLNKYLSQKPVHLLGFSGLKSKHISTITTEKTKLHPLSLPHKIQADPFMNSVSLKPRSIDTEESGLEHPFSNYHLIVGDLTNKYDNEFGYEVGNLLKVDEINQLMAFTQFTIMSNGGMGADTELIRLSKNVEQSGDSIYTKYDSMILRRLDSQLRELNYKPGKEGLKKLIYNLQNVGGEGLFSMISEKGTKGLLNSAVKGLLGTALAMEWYKTNLNYQEQILISLDSYLSKIWLSKRKEHQRSDFLGIRMMPDKSISLDIIEVKGYEATTDSTFFESHPVKQLRSIASLLIQMLINKGDLFIDRRRELLRLQIFKECLQYETKPDVEWINLINQVIDGDIKVNLNLILFEVTFDENLLFSSESFVETKPLDWKDVHTLPIERIKLGEEQIQKFLSNYDVNQETNQDEESVETEVTNQDEESVETEVTNQDEESVETKVTNQDEESAGIEDEKLDKEQTDDGECVKSEKVEPNSNAKILLGTVQNGTREIFWDHSREIKSPLSNHNVIITGDPGKGKTQSIKGIIHDMRRNKIPLILMDFKDDYIDKTFLENEGIEMYDIMEKGLPFNPLVPSVDKETNTVYPNGHIIQLEGIIQRIYGLGDIQTFNLRQAMRASFIAKGIDPKKPQLIEEDTIFPNFSDVYEILMEDPKKNVSLLSRLDLLFGLFPDDSTNTFEDLLSKSYTLRLTKLPTDEIKSAVAEILILAMHNYFSSQVHPRKLTRGIVLDEAHRVSNSDILATFARECRAFGISIIIATQFPTDMSGEIYGCTETKLFLGNDDPKHARAASEKLIGSSNRDAYLKMADLIRGLKQFNAVIRNEHYDNILIDITPYFKKI